MEKKIWCIKVSSNAAFLFKGGKRVEHSKNIVGVAIVELSTSSLVKMSYPAAKKLLKVIVSYKPLSRRPDY